MFVTLKTLLRTLLLPPAGPLLLAFAGAWLLGRSRRGPPPRLRAARGGTGIAVGAVDAGRSRTGSPTRPSVSRCSTSPAIPDAQAIVILGRPASAHAAPEYAGLPAAGGDLLERLAYGAYVAHRTDLPVLVSGNFSETQAMRTALARDFGVTVRWVESDSRDTFENAQLRGAHPARRGRAAHPAGHRTPRTSSARCASSRPAA